jgi:hypothetical protein
VGLAGDKEGHLTKGLAKLKEVRNGTTLKAVFKYLFKSFELQLDTMMKMSFGLRGLRFFPCKNPSGFYAGGNFGFQFKIIWHARLCTQFYN